MAKKEKRDKKGAGVPQKQNESEPYLAATFKMYALWKSLPPVLRDISNADLERRYGIDTPLIIELLKIRNQGEFATQYEVGQGTLSDWNTRLLNTNPFPQLRMWSSGMLRNIILAGYENAINKKSQTAFIDRAALLKFHGLEDKSVVRVEGMAEGLLAEIRKKRNPSAA